MMMKKITAVLLACLLIMSSTATVSAVSNEPVSPRYVNTSNANVSFTINDSGEATVALHCLGYSFVTSITAKTYLERKVGTAWVDVNLGTTDDVWIDSTTSTALIKSHTCQLYIKGQYRVTTEFTVTGTSQTETFSLSQTCTYS